jgi:CHASE3 domain sensor protein
MMKAFLLLLVFCAVAVCQTPQTTPTPTPVSFEDLRKIQAELQQELEALRVEMGTALKGPALRKAIAAERALNEAQKKKLASMQAEIDQGKVDAANLRAEVERLKLVVSERDKLIEKLQKQHRAQRRKIKILVLVGVIIGIVAAVK